MGADGELASSLVEEKTTVTRVATVADLAATGDPRGRMLLMFSGGATGSDTPAAIVLDGADPATMVGASMRFSTGGASGRRLFCTGAVDDMLLGGAGTGKRFEGVRAGDEVLVDNREYLAFTYFHRYQDDARAPEYAQFRVDGRPVYPQRERNFARSGLLSGGTPRGEFTGKMIVVQNAHDAACWPNAAISYRRTVERHLGDALGDHYRLWFNDHAAHLPASFNPVGDPPVPTTRLVDYGGSLEQALRDLMAWVEDGTAPPAETGYTMGADQRLTLASTAAERGGVQPVVHSGGERRRTRRRRGRRPRDLHRGGRRTTRWWADHRGRVGLRRIGRLPVRPRRDRRITRVAPRRDDALVRRARYLLPVCPGHRPPRRRRGGGALPAGEPRARARRRALTVTRPRRRPEFLGRTALTGVGYTDLTKASGRSVLDLASEACAGAIADAGLTVADVDGVASFRFLEDSVPSQAVATALGMAGSNWLLDLNLGGQAPCYLVTQAAMAVHLGLARHVVVFRALNGRSGARVGTSRAPGPGTDFRYPVGLTAYVHYISLWARRFLVETGQSEDDLAAVAIAQRGWAERNERAYLRAPHSLDAHRAAPYVAEPFRVPDCTVEVDGACAVVVSDLDDARDAAPPPVVLQGAAYAAGPGAGLDMGDSMFWADLSRNYTSRLRDDLWGSAGVAPADVDLAEIYDCFTSTVLMGLEGLDLAERGGSGEFVRRAGLPVNTHGGLLAEGVPARDEHPRRGGAPAPGARRLTHGRRRRDRGRDVGRLDGRLGAGPGHRPVTR